MAGTCTRVLTIAFSCAACRQPTFLLSLAALALTLWQLHSLNLLTNWHQGIVGRGEARMLDHATAHLAFMVVSGVFITRGTSGALLQAFLDAAAAHNSGGGAMDVQVAFYVGNSGHPSQDTDPAGLGGHVVKAPFAENMNGGKTFEWFAHAAREYPNASFIFKCDTDTAVNWGALQPYLEEALATGPDTYIGHMNDWDSCGHFSHCPPKGCRNMTGPCFVYMSGGFYGLSDALARKVAACPYALAHNTGPEDLVTGRDIKECGDGAENVVHVRNGIGW